MVSAYIHIPFCNDICSYCDFCKMKYKSEWVNSYFNSLEEEIKTTYKGELVRTLYIGGGTPSILSTAELTRLFDIIKLLNLECLEEFTIECNIESITNEKLILFKKNNVNRLSIGIQTFNPKYLQLLNRHHTKEEVFSKIEEARMIGFDNISVDLIYALPNETMEDLEKDVDEILKLNVNHVSCYSLMILPNTKLYIDNYKEIDEDVDYEMYEYIEKRLTNRDYIHYEISNYSKQGMEGKHNLVYWNNQKYYGFGLAASSYLDNIRYDNTKNFNKYINSEYINKTYVISEEDRIKYELMLGFRKLKGINKNEFIKKFNKDIHEIENINKLLSKGMLQENDEFIYIRDEWIYKSNEILVDLI